MRILGIDPGATTGWAYYDAESRKVIASGKWEAHHVTDLPPGVLEGPVAIERPKGYGPTRPQMVECGITFGRLAEWFEGVMECKVCHLTRLEVCQTLSEALHGVIRVRNDSTAWAALLELHGGIAAARKEGPLYGVKAHGRAALAVAVAYSLRVGATSPPPCWPR